MNVHIINDISLRLNYFPKISCFNVIFAKTRKKNYLVYDHQLPTPPFFC